ncbi:MAG: hypothetical protein ACXAB4_06980 [Candidatus Hodarchaeales archaeon]|jgi:hypothetical protein
MRKLVAVLQGMTITPIVTKRRRWHTRRGGQVQLVNTHKTSFSKLAVGTQRPPNIFMSYEGTVQIRRKCSTEAGALDLLNYYVQIRKLGRFKNEGMGVIEWKKAWIENYQKPQGVRKQSPHVRIRKELPKGELEHGGLPLPIKRLVLYFLLHDFFHTRKHRSKIFYELELEKINLMDTLRRSHDESKPEDLILRTMARFDQFAAMFGRKQYTPVKGRYNLQAQQQDRWLEDRQQLARELSKVANEQGVDEVYSYIYASEELDWLVESRNYGFSSLRTHLLIGANLIVHSYQKGYLDCFLAEMHSSSAEFVVA